MAAVNTGTKTVTQKTNLVDLDSLQSTKDLRNYKKSVIEPKGVEFNKRQTEYQLFPEEYFTGADVYVYFNDVWMDEIIGLTFSLTELVEPQFGYASSTWDYVSRGKRLVKGEFRMAFKEAGYMFVVLDHIGVQGNKKKTAISWLLNDTGRDIYDDKYRGIDGVPDGYMDVLERIETGLQRLYGDDAAKAKSSSSSKKEKYRWEFGWDLPLKIGSPDTKMKDARTSKKYTTQIKQLQQRLTDLGFGFPEWNPKWSKYYGTHLKNVSSSKVSFVTDYWMAKTGKKGLGPKKGNWYVGARYWPKTETYKGVRRTIHKTMIPGNDERSAMVKQLQARLYQYPGGNDTFWTGSSKVTDSKKRLAYIKAGSELAIDGRYGSGPTGSIKILQKLAGVDDGSDGLYISEEMYKTLKLGLKINGKYDVATRVAVWLFQDNQIKKKGNKYKIKAANGIVDLETRKALAEDAERTVKTVTPGENRYKAGETAEPLFALYEKEVWGAPFVNRAEDVRKLESFFYRSRRSNEHGIHLESLYQEGFDIYINYGPFPQYVQSRMNKINNAASFNTTVKAIRNIQLTDVRQILDADTGQPIEEVYSFIAQDLD